MEECGCYLHVNTFSQDRSSCKEFRAAVILFALDLKPNQFRCVYRQVSPSCKNLTLILRS